jgi:anti-sigma factor RsiW
MPDDYEPGEKFDEELSALHDGEASTEAQSVLNARAQEEPETAARLAVFSQLDKALRALPERPVPDDLGLRLQRALGSAVPHRSFDPVELKRRLPAQRSRRWIAAAGLAAAAALVLYWSSARPVPKGTDWVSPGLVVLEDSAMRGSAAEISEEEVGIALHYDTLANLEVIEQLEMLELLAALDTGGPRG